jgi:hypothetical protein
MRLSGFHGPPSMAGSIWDRSATGGLGKDDIWRARQEPSGWRVENAGPALNSADAEYELQPAPDSRWGILATDKGLFRVVAGATGWQRAERFDPPMGWPPKCGR